MLHEAMIRMQLAARSSGKWRLTGEAGGDGRTPIEGPRVGGEDNKNHFKKKRKPLNINENQ